MTRFQRIFLFALLLATGTTAHAQTVPAAATLVSPSGTITTTTPAYTWNAVSNATYYQLWVDSAGTWYPTSAAGCGSGAGACSITASSALSAGSHTWYVQTWNNSGYGPWSSGMSFTVSIGGGVIPVAATPVSPSGTISTSTPTYTWNAVSNASYYYLWDGTAYTWYSASAAGCGSGTGICSITASSALALGSYTWYVQTWNSSGYGPWSSGMNFTVCSNCAPTAATPVSPSGVISTATPAYTWNAVSNASWYYLSDGAGIRTWYSASAAGCASGAGVCSITGSSALAAGNYTWYVQTWNSNGYGPWSGGMGFAITGMNDTGITASQCYQAGSDTLVACSISSALALNNAQDGMVGRDANAATNSNTDGKLGFSFALVAGGCVQDNVTGLMWEVKTNDGGLRDFSKTYTNYSATYNPSNQYGAATDAAGFVAAVNASNLCGHNDWRLPSADELHSIVDYSVAGLGTTIDANWFPNTQGDFFWSSSPHVGYSDVAWYVGFGDGYVSGNYRYNSSYVRLVRAGPSQTTSRYTVSADGQEVTDNQTRLIWRRCAEGMAFGGGACTGMAYYFTHEAALQRAAAQATSSGVAWRLPNAKELVSIADRSRSNLAIDPAVFPNMPSWLFGSVFWSSSPYVGNSNRAWYVNFGDGYVSVGSIFGSRGYSNYVRLVRAGQ